MAFFEFLTDWTSWRVTDLGTLSLIILFSLLFLLAIGMPLGLASAILAVLVLVLKFSFDGVFRSFGSGPLGVLEARIYDVIRSYPLISVPLFIFMANLLERAGIAEEMYSSLNVWLNRTRGGVAIVTSLMAVLMAAMSGIIGGEVVLLGLIALPQMLRLGYNQNLAIGTICASGSLGTMIPPSIVLIIYGLITETSIKNLFTGAFLPGFMLASFIIIYIVIRTQLDPKQAPLPEPTPEDMPTKLKWQRFSGFLLSLIGLATALLLVRAAYLTISGLNVLEEGVDPILLGMPEDVPFIAGFLGVILLAILGTPLRLAGLAVAAVLAIVVFLRNVFGVDPLGGMNEPLGGLLDASGLVYASLGILMLANSTQVNFAETAEGMRLGKGLIAPLGVIFVVLGSIYGGITGITEAAAMGAVAVFLIALGRGRVNKTFMIDSLKRTIKSTGIIIWVTIGATALAGAVTIAGIPDFTGRLVAESGLSTMGVILAMMVLFLFLGAFMDWVGIVLLVMPIFLPIVRALPIEEIGLIGELDPRHVAIWFGVVFCMNMQVSFLSPPFGPAAFYLKSVAPPHISLVDIFRGFLPFILIQILALSVLLIYPNLVTVFLD